MDRDGQRKDKEHVEDSNELERPGASSCEQSGLQPKSSGVPVSSNRRKWKTGESAAPEAIG